MTVQHKMSSKGTAYLVDDEAVVRDALVFLLGSRGLVVHAFDGAPVQGVFLLDVRMEPMSGLVLHEARLPMGVNNPVMFVDRIEQALAVGAALTSAKRSFAGKAGAPGEPERA